MPLSQSRIRMVIFVALFSGIIVLLHMYLWRRLIRDTMLPPPWHQTANGMLWALMAILFLMVFLFRQHTSDVARWALLPGRLWLGVLFVLVSLTGVSELFRLGLWIKQATFDNDPTDASRRLFMARLFGGSTLATGLALSAWSVRGAFMRPVTKNVPVRLPRWPSALNGFRIVQISDLHVGPTLGRAWVEDVVERVNALKPDLVVITGDLIDGSVEELWSEVEPLAKLSAQHGVFFCTGNHEYYSGAQAWCLALPRLNIRVLRNECVSIGDSADPNGCFDLAGIDDYSAQGMEPGHGSDLAAATAKHRPDRELDLLAHQPRSVIDAARFNVGLQLSGHTHGGQIWPFHYLIALQQPYLAGLVRHEETQLYINQGTGFWGPPMRLGSTSEITELTIHRADV